MTVPDRPFLFSVVGSVFLQVDLGLRLVGKIVGRDRAEAIQLFIEYDTQLPFDSGHPSKESKESEAVTDHVKAMLRRQGVV